MKIGIFTQPLHTNYGGLLQAFALQKFLRDKGHDALTIDYRSRGSRWLFPYRFARRCIAKFILRRKIELFPRNVMRNLGKETSRFVYENICTTPTIFAPARSRDFAEYKFDAFVVGSDQTWRPAYSPYMPTFFLDFLGDDTQIRRIAYAASFGKEEWDEWSPTLTSICAQFAKKFHAISVREDSGLDLCERNFGVKAEHHIDPTMLLNRGDYCALIASDESRGLLPNKSAGTLFCYILDDDIQKKQIIEQAEKTLLKERFEIMPTQEELQSGTAIFPPVTAWLRGFRDADFVVTDSFHGCVFSIIFNKPFLAIGNASRGMSRFNSLLKMFGLESRLVFLGTDNLSTRVAKILATPIEWDAVNARRALEQQRSCEFLSRALTPSC